MNELKNFFPTLCPECHQPLKIEFGKSDDVIKLICTNKNCIGTIVKRLQKGIMSLEIKGLGPAVIESLLNAGINNSYDLFDPNIFNKEKLISSGEFKDGRALEKIIDSVKSVKKIPIHKAILSLQIENIGKTFSEKIGMLFSGLEPDLTGLLISIREDLEDKTKGIYKEIEDSIKKFEDFGIEITRYEKPKELSKNEIKTISKIVSVSDLSIIDELSTLDWKIVDSKSTDVDFHVCIDKNNVEQFIKDNNIKVMTLKQIKLIFL